MIKDRLVVRSETDNHVLFKIFKAYYLKNLSVSQPYYDHHHSEFEISVIQSGSGVYSCAGVDYEFRAGDVFMHCGNDIHCFKQINRDESLSLLVIQFEPRLIWKPGKGGDNYKYLQIFMGDNDDISRHICSDSQCAENIGRLLEACFEESQNQEPAYEMFIEANLLLVLANLVRYFCDDLNGVSYQVKTKNMLDLERSMDYILKHLDENLTLDELAREAGMSRSHYSTMFKSFNGISVWTYITRQRIDKAQYLLESTDISIIDISGKCGFGNISNFNRAFKKITGKTPSEYRNGCG